MQKWMSVGIATGSDSSESNIVKINIRIKYAEKIDFWSQTKNE